MTHNWESYSPAFIWENLFPPSLHVTLPSFETILRFASLYHHLLMPWPANRLISSSVCSPSHRSDFLDECCHHCLQRPLHPISQHLPLPHYSSPFAPLPYSLSLLLTSSLSHTHYLSLYLTLFNSISRYLSLTSLFAGINLKSAGSMKTMKHDMGGSAAALGTFLALTQAGALMCISVLTLSWYLRLLSSRWLLF